MSKLTLTLGTQGVVVTPRGSRILDVDAAWPSLLLSFVELPPSLGGYQEQPAWVLLATRTLYCFLSLQGKSWAVRKASCRSRGIHKDTSSVICLARLHSFSRKAVRCLQREGRACYSSLVRRTHTVH